MGLSWRGNPELDGVGGICQSRVRIKSDRNAYSFNALFISLKSLQEIRIPLRMGVLNLGRCKMQTELPHFRTICYEAQFLLHFTPTLFELVHELMHSFGAKHDPDPTSEPECTPQDKVRKLRQISNTSSSSHITKSIAIHMYIISGFSISMDSKICSMRGTRADTDFASALFSVYQRIDSKH